ncbi:MAG: glycosyltransferase family 2 protein [Halorhabdus sp.]
MDRLHSPLAASTSIVSRTFEALGVLAWVVFPVYAMWNIPGAATLVLGALAGYVSQAVVTSRQPLPEPHVTIAGITISGAVMIGALAMDTLLYESLFVFDLIPVMGVLFSASAGYLLCESDYHPGIVVFGSVVVLPLVSLLLIWFSITPPCTTCALFGAHPPFSHRLLTSDAVGVLRTWAALSLPVVRYLAVTATGIGTLVFIYLVSSMVSHIVYTTQTGVEKVEDLTVVVVTVASEEIRDTLFAVIDHNRRLLDEYEFCVVIDEGADLQPELEETDIDLVVVPDSFDPDAIAKGRAMQYFVEHNVEADRWYAFIDDDNLVQDRAFLYEIPAQEADGKLVMNPILVPRKGRSWVTFAIDHMRTLFDFTFFRTFTGLLGRPYAGLHGELLCARGDVLQTIGFDRASIVEDFVFADELIRRDIPTWQSQTVVSILSPHTLEDYFTQRARWFTGKLAWLPRSSPGTILVTGLVQGVWLIGIFGGWLVAGIWFLFGPPFDLVSLTPAIFATVVYSVVYSIGIGRMGARHLPKVLLVPIYATIEHAAPYVAMLKKPDTFEIIRK